MSTILTCFLETTLLPNAAAAQYTAQGVTSKISKLTLTNTSNAAVAVTIYLVPASGTPGSGNLLYGPISIPASGSGGANSVDVVVAEGHVLNPGDSVQAFAGTPGVVGMRISGWQMTGS